MYLDCLGMAWARPSDLIQSKRVEDDGKLTKFPANPSVTGNKVGYADATQLCLLQHLFRDSLSG